MSVLPAKNQNLRMRFGFVRSLILSVSLLLFGQSVQADVEIPESVDDLKSLQEQVLETLRHVMPATVGVSLNSSQASGVIVSADGYVLTASHVSGAPGQRVRIIFSDGRTVFGETLGTNPDVDGSLIRITTPGNWPFAPIVPDDETPELGDWCIATGHPGGFNAGRTPPVRVGRVIRSDRYVLRSDCPITGGDSGGPLFDLKGRVIGIHSRISEDPTDNLHVPAGTYRSSWDELKAGRVGHVAPRSKFLSAFDTNQDGRIERDEIPKGVYRDVYDRLAKEFELEKDQSYDIESLRSNIDLKLTPDIIKTNRGAMIFEGPARDVPQLATVAFTRGRSVLEAFEDSAAGIRNCVVRLKHAGVTIAYATIVDKSGHIITKASELPRDEKNRVKEIVAYSSAGRKVRTKYLTWNSEYDLALLKLDIKSARPVEWSDRQPMQVGQWVVSAGNHTSPLSAGALSVLGRTIPKGRGFLGVVRSENDRRKAGAVVGQVMKDSVAERAGLRAGDVIYRVNGLTVGSFSNLQQFLSQYRTTDKVQLDFRRRGKADSVTIRLGSRPADPERNPTERMNGNVSARRSAFPLVMQHDSVLEPNEVGGPLVDLEGNVIGINIARVNRTATYAIPASRAKQLVAELKAWAKQNGK